MAELLIRVTDKVNPEFYKNTKCTKRGDVIVVHENGWPWGRDELTAPFWRIVKHDELSVSEASAFLAPQFDTDPQHPSRTLLRRAFKLNLDAAGLPAAVRTFLADNERAVPILDITPFVTIDQIRALKIMKSPVEDPNVIG